MEVSENVTVPDDEQAIAGTATGLVPSQPLPPNIPASSLVSNVDQEDFVEYNRLLSLVRDLPCDMFVDRLLLEYNQCDIKLEHTRQMLYNTLRESDDFPYDKEADMKRRVNSRHGDSLATKLAYDIHALLSVADGADYSSIKEIISVSTKRPGRSSSVGRMSQRIVAQSSDRCACRAEIEQLKSTLSTIQADLLLSKQRHAASENLKNTDISSVKKNIDNLKTNQTSMQSELQGCVSEVSKSVETLNLKINEKLTDCDTKIQTISSDFKALEKSVHSLNDTMLRLQQIVFTHHKVSDDTAQPMDSGSISSTISPPSPINAPIVELLQPVSVADAVIQSSSGATDAKETVPQSTPLYATVLCTPVTARAQSQEGDSHFGNMPIPTIVTDRRKKAVKGNKKSQPGNNRDLNFGVIRREIEIVEKAREDEDADFETYVKRKTKSFYVGNVKSSITEEKLSNYIYRRGINVTNVRLFRSRKNDNVVIRVNVEDNENANRLTDDYSFWPRGVICRPWIPYHLRLRKRHSNTNDAYMYNDERHFSYNPPRMQNGFDNRYDALESDVEVD